ncbi:MAG: hypothetical protein LUQ47_01875 [Methanotrichaceae archaeon]|nr:hypothetical protein [Methanotrichaceae archaeon]
MIFLESNSAPEALVFKAETRFLVLIIIPIVLMSWRMISNVIGNAHIAWQSRELKPDLMGRHVTYQPSYSGDDWRIQHREVRPAKVQQQYLGLDQPGMVALWLINPPLSA